jgi:hypothetical protein
MRINAARGQAQRILPIWAFPQSKSLGSAKGGFSCTPEEGARDAVLLPLTCHKFPSPPVSSTLSHTLSAHFLSRLTLSLSSPSLLPNRRAVPLPSPRIILKEEVVHSYISNVSIIFDAPCLFLHHLPCVLLHFVVFLCDF